MKYLTEIKEQIRSILIYRKQSYRIVFSEESLMARAVLKDLAKFCRANESCFHADQRLHAVLEGRREVFLRIINHLNLTSEEFLKKYGGKDLE